MNVRHSARRRFQVKSGLTKHAPDAGDSAVFFGFFYVSAESISQTESTPATAQATQTVMLPKLPITGIEPLTPRFQVLALATKGD